MLDIIDSVSRLHLKSDGFTGKGLHENLHCRVGLQKKEQGCSFESGAKLYCVCFKKMLDDPDHDKLGTTSCMDEPVVAVDFGGSLIKIVYLENNCSKGKLLQFLVLLIFPIYYRLSTSV